MKIMDGVYFFPEAGMLGCNAYIIQGESTLVIDPGFNQDIAALVDAIKKDGIAPDKIDIISNTHLHVDHSLANTSLKEFTGAKIMIHSRQAEFYDVSAVVTSRFFRLQAVEFKPDGLLGDRLDLGGIVLELIPLPGHSPDSIGFYCREKKFLVCGDVLFNQNTGRVDLPGGNADDLKNSIERLEKLDLEYLLPGHMGIVNGRKKVTENFEFIREYVFPCL